MNLNAVWRVSFTDLCAVGDNGTIIHKPATPETGTINRLLCEHRKTEAGATIYKIEYIFDDTQAKNGNIHKVIYDGNNVTEFQYNEMNEFTGITHPDSTTETLTYDNNGNLIQTTRSGETTSYQRDCFDRLLKVTLPNGEIVEFDYDEDGMLVKQESEGIERKFIQHNRFATRELVKNSNGNWETTANHIIHNQMLSSYIHSNSIEAGNKTNTVFYHTDHLGSVRLITDANGNPIDSISTDAYGNPLPQADSSGNKGAKVLSEFNFVGTHGIRYVEKVKLHNMRARWYDKFLRRFTSTDIFKYMNRYVYVDNQPIISTDISGKSKEYQQLYKRKEILQSLKDKYGQMKTPSPCKVLVDFAKSAIELLLTKIDCPDFDDFVDILAVMVVYNMGRVPRQLGYGEDQMWYPTMYPSSLPFETNDTFYNHFSLHIWRNIGFKHKFQDINWRTDKEGGSNQAHHYLAYSYMTYYLARKSILPFRAAIGISASAVLEHELGRPTYNPGDVRLGMRGVRTGAYFFNFRFYHMIYPIADMNTEQLHFYGNRVIQEIETVCKGKPDKTPLHLFYVPTICDYLEYIY